MMTFYLAAGLIILFFAFQSLHLRFGKHDSFFSGFLFQGAQTPLHGGEVVPQPDRAYSRRRNEYAVFPQLITGSNLPVCRKFDNSLFGGVIHPVFEVGFFAADLKQRLDTSGVSGCLIAVKSISGKAHDAAGFGDIAEFGGQVQKSGLVFDDVFG